ncbi:hypothetical protein CALCODRAFT_234444 [Calocera cornea HHB12733]|uniref:Uncharacterized protein n=1 Tax=Calocera cornea HHB12733 TaxID=1353952 RepID=A0A165GXJ4_9BASI|nr:hypothetical protein CALCODRAFT_234444 [Calocera cornea HHB12733]
MIRCARVGVGPAERWPVKQERCEITKPLSATGEPDPARVLGPAVPGIYIVVGRGLERVLRVWTRVNINIRVLGGGRCEVVEKRGYKEEAPGSAGSGRRSKGKQGWEASTKIEIEKWGPDRAPGSGPCSCSCSMGAETGGSDLRARSGCMGVGGETNRAETKRIIVGFGLRLRVVHVS